MRTHACPVPPSGAGSRATCAGPVRGTPSDLRFCPHVFSIDSEEVRHGRGS